MLYVEWVPKVLKAVEESENDRTRLVGLPVPALREPLGIDLADVDALDGAVYDLEALGLARRRPSALFNLTETGRQAASRSIEAVCGDALRQTCEALTHEERRFVEVLVGLSEAEYELFARMRYVELDRVFEQMRFEVSRQQQESFLLTLVEKNCIDYREFKSARDARPLFTGVMCAPIGGAKGGPDLA